MSGKSGKKECIRVVREMRVAIREKKIDMKRHAIATRRQVR